MRHNVAMVAARARRGLVSAASASGAQWWRGFACGGDRNDDQGRTGRPRGGRLVRRTKGFLKQEQQRDSQKSGEDASSPPNASATA
jgi:hypothetical protein